MAERSTGSPTHPGTRATPQPLWTVDLHASRSSFLRIGLLLADEPPEKSVVVVITGRAGSRPIDAVKGLTWSAGIGAFYSYFPPRCDWYSDRITFAEPVDSVDVRLLSWPARTPLAASSVRRVFVETRSELERPAVHALHFPKVPAR